MSQTSPVKQISENVPSVPKFQVPDEDGRGGNFFVLTPTGPALRLQDRRGNEILLTVKYDTGEASVGIANNDGKVLWSAP